MATARYHGLANGRTTPPIDVSVALFADQTSQLGDAGGAEYQGYQRRADSGDQQRDSQRGTGGHPQERDLGAAGVLHQEDDQQHGEKRGDSEGHPGRSGTSGTNPHGQRGLRGLRGGLRNGRRDRVGGRRRGGLLGTDRCLAVGLTMSAVDRQGVPLLPGFGPEGLAPRKWDVVVSGQYAVYAPNALVTGCALSAASGDRQGDRRGCYSPGGRRRSTSRMSCAPADVLVSSVRR